MKKTIALMAIIIAAPILGFGQKNKEYKASNNITYKIGDTVMLGKGSAPNGDFLYLQLSGWAGALSGGSSDVNNIGKRYANTNVIIKKIKKSNIRGAEKISFIVAGGNISNYELYIEQAIVTSEIAGLKIKKTDDVFVKIEKLKKLFDNGFITLEEFEQRKKILLESI